MKKKLLAVAMGAMLAAGAAFAVARDACFDLVRVARDRWNDPFPEVAMLTAPAAPKPGVELVVSKSFLARLAQRVRPKVTPRWRMCPSA